jgi:hypothetical protein
MTTEKNIVSEYLALIDAANEFLPAIGINPYSRLSAWRRRSDDDLNVSYGGPRSVAWINRVRDRTYYYRDFSAQLIEEHSGDPPTDVAAFHNRVAELTNYYNGSPVKRMLRVITERILG